MSRATAALFIGLTLGLAAACDKVPLLAPTESTLNLAISTTTLPVNGTAQVVATVIEPAGTPVHNGTMVTFIGSLGTFDPPEAPTQNGRAVTTFRAGSQSGTARINAVSGAARGEEIEVLVGGAAAEQVTVRATPPTVLATGGTTDIVALVRDVNGNPLPGTPVSFSSDNGSLSSNSALTDANGEARVTLTTSRETVVTVTAGPQTAEVTVRAVTLPTVTIALASGSTQPEVGVPVNFTVTPGEAATGNPIRSVVVDYGDGSQDNLGAISAAATVSHTYASPGQYRVTATITDVQGLSQSSSLIVQVNARSALAVTMTASPNPVSISNVGQQGLVEFTATAVSTSGIQFYSWSFGDGTSAVTTGGSTNHRYTAPGTYTARVTVRASNGQEGFSERTVRVNP